MRRRLTVTKTRPAHWPAPEDVPGEYPTVWGVLVITDKFVSHYKEASK